jgi:homogentisate 1,2-dioxygenase
MTGHGPDAATYKHATQADLTQPDIIRDSVAFMFETRLELRPARHALESPQRQRDYFRCWQDMQKHFDPGRR